MVKAYRVCLGIATLLLMLAPADVRAAAAPRPASATRATTRPTSTTRATTTLGSTGVSPVAPQSSTTCATTTQASTQLASSPATQPSQADKAADDQATEDQMMAMLKARMPGHYEKLMALRKSSPAEYQEARIKSLEWYREWRRLPQSIQDAYILRSQLRVRQWSIIDRLREHPAPGETAKLHKELAQIVAERFDAEQQEKEYDLKESERNLERKRAVFRDCAKNRDQLIQRQTDELLRSVEEKKK